MKRTRWKSWKKSRVVVKRNYGYNERHSFKQMQIIRYMYQSIASRAMQQIRIKDFSEVLELSAHEYRLPEVIWMWLSFLYLLRPHFVERLVCVDL